MDAQDQTVTMRHVLMLAKSPLLRIHDVPVFLMHVTGLNDGKEHFLLGRGEDASRFHVTTSVGLSYNVSGLIPTTVTKGTAIPRKILLLSKSCRIEPCRADAPELAAKGICAQKVTIVSCVDRCLGIYELKNHQRLYLTYQYDGKTPLPVLPVGFEATVSNPHKFVRQHDEDSSGPTRREDLVCCMRSTISLHGLDEGVDTGKVDRDSPGRILLALCAKLHPTLGALDWLRRHMVPVLSQKLSPDIARPKDLLKVCLKVLTTRLASCEGQIMSVRSRNLYEEFLSHDTACCISDEQFEPFSFAKIGEIRDFIDCELKSGSDKVSTMIQASRRYSVIQAHTIKPQMILVAELCVEGADGGIFLRDASGLLACVVLDRGPVERETDEEHTNPGHEGPRDLASAHCVLNQCQPSPCLSHLLRIDKFTLVREEEIVNGTEGEAASTAHDSTTSGSPRVGRKTQPTDCVIFDISQALCLHQGRRVEQRDGKRGKRKRSAQNQDRDGDNLTSRPPSNSETVTVHVLSRRHMLRQPLESKDGGGQQTPRFFCDILVMKRTDFGNIAGKRRQHSRSDKQLMRDSELKWEPAILGFQGDAVRWYHFLRRCRNYQLQTSGPEDAKGAAISSVKKLTEKGLAQPVYIADSFSQLLVLQNSDIEVCHLCCNGMSLPARKKRSRWQQTVTSVSGLLTKKIVQTPEEVPHTSTCTLPEGPRVLITLRQAGSVNELSATIPSWLHVTINGLIPGAFVTLQDFLCKDSGGGGKVLTYEASPLSSIRIDEFCVQSFTEIGRQVNSHHIQSASLDEEGSATSMAPQRSFLYDIITGKAAERGALRGTWLYAHVQSIKRFILRWVCHRCGRNDCKCPEPANHNGRLCTSILCSIDDGSGEALVWSDKPQVVRAILDLSARQWGALETSCLGPDRELVFHQPTKQQREEETPSSSVLTQRLSTEVYRYCRHSCSNIQRSIWLKCRQFRDSSRGQATSDDWRASSQGLTLCCEEARPASGVSSPF